MDDCPLEIDHAYFRAGARRPHDATKRPVLRGRVATVTKQSPVTVPRIPRGGHLLQFSAPPTEEKRFRPAWTNLWFARINKNGRMTLFGSCGQFLEALKCWMLSFQIADDRRSPDPGIHFFFLFRFLHQGVLGKSDIVPTLFRI